MSQCIFEKNVYITPRLHGRAFSALARCLLNEGHEGEHRFNGEPEEAARYIMEQALKTPYPAGYIEALLAMARSVVAATKAKTEVGWRPTHGTRVQVIDLDSGNWCNARVKVGVDSFTLELDFKEGE